MARFCVRDGITHVVATPHCHRVTRLLRPDILPRVVRLNEELSQAGVPLTILPGSEVQVVDAAAYRSDFEASLYCHLGDGRGLRGQHVKLLAIFNAPGRGAVTLDVG